MRAFVRTLCALIFLLCWEIGTAGDFSVFGGKMLNNSRPSVNAHIDDRHGPDVRGLSAGVGVSRMWGSHGAGFSYTRVGETEIAEDMAYSLMEFLERRGRFTFGVGVVSQMTYSTWGWWEGGHYPNDGVHFSKSCRWCGSSYRVDYAATRRLAVRAIYIAQNRLDPTYNGLTVLFVFSP